MDVSALLGSLTVQQWFLLGQALLKAEPAVYAALQALHPALNVFISDIKANQAAREPPTPHRVYSAAVAARDWMAANAQGAIDVETSMEDRSTGP